MLKKNPQQGQSLVTGKAGTICGRLHSTIAVTIKVCERLEPDALSGLLKALLSPVSVAGPMTSTYKQTYNTRMLINSHTTENKDLRLWCKGFYD